MKNLPVILGAVLASLLVGCATPVAFAPIGPNPSRPANAVATGQLEVYSALHKCRDGNEYDINPA